MSRLKAKEDELVLVGRQLEDESAWLASAAAETASSDGGETVVPDIDFSKISYQVKKENLGRGSTVVFVCFLLSVRHERPNSGSKQQKKNN